MKLIGSLTSPYVRKVRVVLAEKRIDYDFQLDNPWNSESHVREHNPLGKVPVLVMDDGTNLFDSRVIVDYLDTVTPVSRLIPDTNRHRIVVKRWEALADGICDAAGAVFLENKRPAKQQNKDWIARQQKKVALGLEAAAHDLGEKNWCDGEAYSLADIAMGCVLGYLDFRFAEIEWRSAYPNLAKLSDKLATRASFKDTMPQG